VEHPSNPRADAAYERALAAYRDQSYDVARRWVGEALAHNKQHAGARALQARLDASRSSSRPFEEASSGPDVISTDPTVLISRASLSQPAPDAIDPTIIASRADVRRRTDDTDAGRPAPLAAARPRPMPAPAADQTVIGPAKPRASSGQKAGFSLGAALQSLGQRVQGGQRPQRPGATSRSGSAASPAASRSGPSGALLALGTVAVGALLVIALMFIGRWMFPAGKVLTITRPNGGTIVGPGIECGTAATRCSTTIATGDPIELETRPDKDHVFSGYTGDCAPAGRTAMTEARTCGANFDQVAGPAATATFRLTITKPEGGTIVAAGGILCGVNGSTCSADLPSGAPVTLKADAADGFAWEQFTGDCPSTGEMAMTSAKTCGATFIRSAAPINVGPPPSATLARPRPTPAPRPTPVAPAPTATAPTTPAPVPTNPAGSPGATPTTPTATPTVPDKPPPPPISAEEHAKQEIGQLVKNYCAALGTLKPATIRSLFHLDNERELKDKFKEYKSLKCTPSSPPEYDRLDASPAGAAQVKFGMKQAVEMKSGGAPKALDLLVTMVVSRKGFQSAWLIDRVTVEEKPK
jgi:hypothetical protein